MISFQELCLQYGEKNLTRTMLIDFIKQREKYLQLCIECKEKEISLLDKKAELKQKACDDRVQKLKSDYDYLYKKWEEFSKCLDMKPEKFISMLDDLKEKIKSKANEITHLREQLKTSELDAKRYKNDGIQDRVRLQEVTEELEKVKKLIDTPCKEVKELIDNLKQMNDDKMDTISRLEATLFAVNKDKEVMLSYYAKELESIIKMRDNWKADCEYSEKCFEAERNRRWELEEEVKQLKKQLVESEVCNSDYIRNRKELDEVCPKIKIDLSSCYNTSNKNKLGDLYVQVVHMSQSRSRLYLTTKDGKSFFNSLLWVYLDIVDGLYKNDNFIVHEDKNRYLILDALTSRVLYRVNKDTQEVTPVPYLSFEKYEEPVCLNSNVTIPYNTIYLKVGLRKVYVDKNLYDPRLIYMICEDSKKQKYCIVRANEVDKRRFKNYSVDKETFEVKVID